MLCVARTFLIPLAGQATDRPTAFFGAKLVQAERKTKTCLSFSEAPPNFCLRQQTKDSAKFRFGKFTCIVERENFSSAERKTKFYLGISEAQPFPNCTTKVLHPFFAFALTCFFWFLLLASG